MYFFTTLASIIGIFLFPLFGCTGLDVHPKHVANAEKACKDHGGWVQIRSLSASLDARCHDGTYIDSNEIQK